MFIQKYELNELKVTMFSIYFLLLFTFLRFEM